MKKLVLAGAALAALSATAASAHPHQGPGQAQPVTRASVEARVDAGFARLDSDRDGFVTQAEARARAEAFRAERQERRGERTAQRGERRAALFARLDADRDGQISRAEFDARPALRGDRAERREARAERRGDRRGFRVERRGQGGGMFARLGGRLFEAADANDDGRVSREEARRGALARFDRVDSNRDGVLSIDERRAAREQFRAQRGPRRRG